MARVSAVATPPPSPITSLSVMGLEGVFFLFPIVPYNTIHVGPRIHVPAQGGEHLYLQVGDGLGGGGKRRCGHGAVKQRVGRVAARRVGGLPVRLQVVSQVFASVLQLVFVQDDVE